MQENHFDVAGQLISLCAQQILFSNEKEFEKRDLYSGTPSETGVNCGKMNNERQTIVIF